MLPFQFYNHFSDGRELTTKQGLNKNLHQICQYGTDIQKFYPRCYDFSDVKQIDYFLADFNQTAILNIIKSHAKLFKKACPELMKSILDEDSKIRDNIFKTQSKKAIKKKYFRTYPSDQELVEMGRVNIVLLQNAIFYAKNVLNDINETCEGDEYIKRNFYFPRFELSNRVKDYLYLYSTLSFPLQEGVDLPEAHQGLLRVNGWELPSHYLMFLTLKIHLDLKRSLP